MKRTAYIDPETKVALEGEALLATSKKPDSLRCGYELGNDDVFCPLCGAEVKIKSRNLRLTDWWTFDGRATRKEWWIINLACLLCVLSLCGLFMFAISNRSEAAEIFLSMRIGVIFSIVTFFVNVRRLHDLGFSGFMLVINFVISGISYYSISWNEFLHALFMISSGAFNFLLFIYMGFVRGTNGQNKYGPGPLETK